VRKVQRRSIERIAIQSSSVVERSAVNRLVVGSNPTSGANFMFWVYILQNPAGRFYVGHTDNLENRIASHNRTDKISGKFTRKNGPCTAVWAEQHPERVMAMQRECEIKHRKSSRLIHERLLKMKA
jgi:predicted GIY-YIG superfamily endonuclease